MNRSKIKLASEGHLENIINEKPSWFIRNGLFIFLILMLICLEALTFVKYRTSIEGKLFIERGHVFMQIPFTKGDNLKVGEVVSIRFTRLDSSIVTGTASFRREASIPGMMTIGLAEVTGKLPTAFFTSHLEDVDISYSSSIFHVISERWKGRYNL